MTRLRGLLKDPLLSVRTSSTGRGYEDGKKIAWRDGVVALWVLLKYRFRE